MRRGETERPKLGDDDREQRGPRPTDGDDRWVDQGRVDRSEGAKRPGPRPRRPERVPVELTRLDDLSPSRRTRVIQLAGEAAAAFAAERYDEARSTLVPLVDRHPEIPEIRELLGLTWYRLGKWRKAETELEAFRDLTHSMDQHPVLADCARARGDHDTVAELWDELREASPDGELVTEGRLVAAGSLADQGDLHGALRLLKKGPTRPRRVRPSTLRLWYAIGDLEERLGDVPGARSTFRRIVDHERDFGDAADRLRELS